MVRDRIVADFLIGGHAMILSDRFLKTGRGGDWGAGDDQ